MTKIVVFIFMIALIILVIFCNIGTKEAIGGYQFSRLFEILEPPINRSLLVYNDNIKKYDRDITKRLLDQYIKYYAIHPKLKEDDKYIQIIYNGGIIGSAITIEDQTSLQVVCSASTLYLYLQELLKPTHELFYYIQDIYNNIDYNKISDHTKQSLFIQLENIRNKIIDDKNRGLGIIEIGNSIIRTDPNEAIASSSTILDGFRSNFYDIYNANNSYFKDPKIKKKAYKKLLKDAPNLYNKMKSLQITDYQDNMYHTLVKRLETLSSD